MRTFIIFLRIFAGRSHTTVTRLLTAMDTPKKNTDKPKERLLWIDWMKSIGIYLIVLGHFFPCGSKYIYTFSVPLFFLVTGFLSKREADLRVFRRKLWYNLVLPMLLISALNFMLVSASALVKGTFCIRDLLLFPIMTAAGFHSGLGCMWFVYTIIVLKLIQQFAPRRRWCDAALFIGLPLLGIWIDRHPIVMGHDIVQMSNAIINATVAYPFFISGVYLRRWEAAISRRCHPVVEVLCLVACMAVVAICASLNGNVWMFVNGYGKNFLLFLLGGYAGTVGVLIVSKWMRDFWSASIVTISTGTIIILGFHYYVINIIQKMGIDVPMLDYVFAALIVIAFIPIIRFTEKHFPYLIGKYRVQSAAIRTRDAVLTSGF